MNAFIASVLPPAGFDRVSSFLSKFHGQDSPALFFASLTPGDFLQEPAFSIGTILKVLERVMLSICGKKFWGIRFQRNVLKLGHVI